MNHTDLFGLDYNNTIERMCAAAWNTHCQKGHEWDKIPEAWKPPYRKSMANALAALTGVLVHGDKP